MPVSTISSALRLPLGVAWTYDARAGFGPDGPLVFENTVMVATRQGEVHLVDLETGKRGGSRRFGDAINGSPVVIGNILVVPLAQGRRALTAYNLDRSEILWRMRGASVQVGITSTESGGIFVNTDGEVQRFRVSDGVVLWKHQIRERTRIHARPLVHDDLVIIATDDGTVKGLSLAEGLVQWEANIEDPIYVTPSRSGDVLLVSTARGRLMAMNLINGEIQWETRLPDEAVKFSTPSADQTGIAVGASDGILRLFDLATGELEWDVRVPHALVAEPLITSDYIFTGTMGDLFYVFDRDTGKILQEIELRGRVKSAIRRVGHGLVILTEPRNVVRLNPLNPDEDL